MIARPTCSVASAILVFVVAGVAPAMLSTPLGLGSLSNSTGQVGVPLSATIQATGGVIPYSYSLTGGTLPNGLNLVSNVTPEGPVTISGTPTAAGTFNFTVMVSDAAQPPPPAFRGQDSQAAARRRGLAQSGKHAADTSGNFTITIAPGATGAAGVPTSPWTLALVMAGLAGAGFWRLRRMRRA
jgi:hypothetical protein